MEPITQLPCGCRIGCKGTGTTTRAYIARPGDDLYSHNDDWHRAIVELIWQIEEIRRSHA